MALGSLRFVVAGLSAFEFLRRCSVLGLGGLGTHGSGKVGLSFHDRFRVEEEVAVEGSIGVRVKFGFRR